MITCLWYTWYNEETRKGGNTAMKHYIIVKFSETVQEKAALYPEIETLFKKAEK